LPLKLTFDDDPDNRTEILAFTCTKDGKKPRKSGLPVRSLGKVDAHIKRGITLKPDEKCTLYVRIQLAKGLKDWFAFQSRHTTENPEITVDCPEDIRYQIDFAARDDLRPVTTGSRSTLQGTLLPFQPVLVSWWPNLQMSQEPHSWSRATVPAASPAKG